MKHSWKTGILLAILLILNLTYSHLVAQPSKRQAEKDFRCRLENDDKLLRGLNLSEEQRQKIEPLILSFKKQRLEHNLEIQEKQTALRRLEITDKPNQQEINKMIDELGEKRAEIQKHKSKLNQDIRKELNEEQLIKYDSRLCNRKAFNTERKRNSKRIR